jgi:hypothetical protein
MSVGGRFGYDSSSTDTGIESSRACRALEELYKL